MIHPIKRLPQVIPIGVQTENGVEPVGFDLRAWLDVWDDLKVSIWPTRPGEAAAYPAANTEMIDTVLYWYPNEADTAISGTGKVELLGLTSDRRKLSGWCDTMIRPTSLATTQEAPEAARPWIDQVIEAGDKALSSASSAAESASRAKEAETKAEDHKNAAATSEREAAKSEKNAVNSASAAATSADRAEMAAAESGWFDVDVNNAGHLIYTRSSTVDNIDFEMEEGRLLVNYG